MSRILWFVDWGLHWVRGPGWHLWSAFWSESFRCCRSCRLPSEKTPLRRSPQTPLPVLLPPHRCRPPLLPPPKPPRVWRWTSSASSLSSRGCGCCCCCCCWLKWLSRGQLLKVVVAVLCHYCPPRCCCWRRWRLGWRCWRRCCCCRGRLGRWRRPKRLLQASCPTPKSWGSTHTCKKEKNEVTTASQVRSKLAVFHTMRKLDDSGDSF